jgi:hypothetical protein
LPDWRDEVCTALDFWIAAEGGGNRTERMSRVGPARPSNERGWYDIDLRGISVTADQAESLRLSSADGPSAGPSYQVLEAAQDGPLVRVRVAEFVSLANAYLWQNKQSPAHLLVKLREGIAGLAEAGLAHDLAAGRLAPRPTIVRPLAGFTAMQREAYESCLATGVSLVWGPPGTGKTRVLTEAMSTLLATGQRVLLVSATNIAVDNALLGVIGARRHQPGVLLRVGLPHHPDVLKHPDVCLPYLVREQLADVEGKRQAIEIRLLTMRQDDDNLARLEAATTGFDPEEYSRAAKLMAAEAAIPRLADAVISRNITAQDRRRDADLSQDEVTAAHSLVQQFDAARSAYADIDRIRSELADVICATDDLSAKVLTARHSADRIEANLREEEGGTRIARMRGRGRIRELKNELSIAQQKVGELEPRAQDASDLLTRLRAASERDVRRLSAITICSRADIEAADAALAAAKRLYARAKAIARQAEGDLGKGQQELIAAEAQPKATEHQRALVRDTERRDLPALADEADALRSAIAAAKPERARLEVEYEKVQEQFDRLRKDAEGEIIRSAQLVATTLARLRTSKALMDGPYDVVLVDEVGAATLPEVLLAVSRAKRAAVLLGDFLQLGAVVKKVVEQARRDDVQRWLCRDVFEHCGITTPEDALRHPGCTALDVQHRFGLEITRLANAVAYDGLLKPNDSVRPRPDDDPEIVLIDVDGLGDLARVRAVGRRSGWWPAGALLGRVLADYHHARGERTGIVAPYNPQVNATLEALRDREPASTEATEVGTVHRFQGREFPVLVFDLVEDEYDTRWMALASSRDGKWRRDGLRLFTVAVTRAKTRLYLIGSRKQIYAAPTGTPLAQIAQMLRARQVRTVPATRLITPTSVTAADFPAVGPFTSELAEVLAQHVLVANIHDERSFYEVFADHLNSAQRSIWIWAAWTAKRVRSLIPALADAAARGVRITLFVRDSRDSLQGNPQFQHFLAELRAVVTTVVEINVMHQKIVVIDEETVLLGSLNTLSQSWTREVMLTMHGTRFAQKLLEHEHAMDFATPPRCGACKGAAIDLRRSRSGEWYWRCYASACPSKSAKGGKAWTQPALNGARQPKDGSS